jgi:hypothetical protein
MTAAAAICGVRRDVHAVRRGAPQCGPDAGVDAVTRRTEEILGARRSAAPAVRGIGLQRDARPDLPIRLARTAERAGLSTRRWRHDVVDARVGRIDSRDVGDSRRLAGRRHDREKPCGHDTRRRDPACSERSPSRSQHGANVSRWR